MDSDPALTNTFIELSNMPSSISLCNLNNLERFVIDIYRKKGALCQSDINDMRVKSFFKSADPNLRSIVLSRKALIEHTKRSTLQAGWMWKECEGEVILQDPRDWGWVLTQDASVRYSPLWQDSFSDIHEVIMVCSCKGGRCTSCKCGKKKISCLHYCNCQRKCLNP